MIQTTFHEIEEHLRRDTKPSLYIEKLCREGALDEPPFHYLAQLKEVPQSPKYHPEGNVWNHTMLVLDEAAVVKDSVSDPEAFMWGALLHDIGKASTTRSRKGKITAYGHDKEGARMVKDFFAYFDTPPDLPEMVTALVKWHMQPLYVEKDLPFGDIQAMKEQLEVREIALLSLCDRLGRAGADKKKEKEMIRLFLQKCGES